MNLDVNNIIVSSNYRGVDNEVSRIFDSSGVLPEKMGRRGISSPVLSYFGSRNSLYNNYEVESYASHEYDLYEYSRIIDTEAIVYKAFERKKTIMLKDGFTLRSHNDENIAYINQRLREFKFVSGLSFEEFLEQLTYNMIAFHNAYVLIVRNEKHSTAEQREANNTSLDPIAAVFNFPTESMKRVISDTGYVSKYKQDLGNGKYKIFQGKNVRHLTYNKRSGFTMGTPPLEPVKDDILALRRIEESVETLIYKSLFPIIHVKVGSDANPAKILQDGSSEVSQMNRVLREIDDYGGVVTSERVEIKAIGSESLALRVETYLKYFFERVMIGIGVSATDLGLSDSTGKTTGSIISQNLKEASEDLQRVIANFITEEIFTELLVESGKYDRKYLIPEEDLVIFKFNDIDKEGTIKEESHLLNLANSGVITYQEFRVATGRRPMTDKELREAGEWAEKLLPPIDVAVKKASIEASKASDASSVAPSTGTPSGSVQSSSNNVSKKVGASNASSSVVAPSNQYSDSMSFIDQLVVTRDDRLSTYAILMSELESSIDINDSNINIGTIKHMCEDTSEFLYSLGSNNIESKILDSVSELFLRVEELCRISKSQ